MMQKIKHFFAESRQELRHVNWPSREEATRLTIVVIGISAALAIFLGIFDFILADAIRYLIEN